MEHETKEVREKGASLPCSNGGLSRELRVRKGQRGRSSCDCYHTALSGCNSAFRRLTFLFILPFGHVRRRYPLRKGQIISLMEFQSPFPVKVSSPRHNDMAW